MSTLIVGSLLLAGLLIGMEMLLRPIRRAVERSATAAELSALYARELCWRTHDAARQRNGRGELMRWQDPAEIDSIAGSILADAEKRSERKRQREAQYGPDPTSYRYSDTGPEAEAAKAASQKSSAEFDAWLKSIAAGEPGKT
jgi:hypothetical protein